jgi:hypothetical protein
MAIERKKSIQFVQQVHGQLVMRSIDDQNIHVYDAYNKLKFTYHIFAGWRRVMPNGDLERLNDDDLQDDLASVAQLMLFREA